MTRATLSAALRRARGAEVAAAGIVLAMVVAMILPLPSWLLDGLIALNICSSALLLVMVVQIKESVSLSTFPTLLLITTLFRLSLSVASTRLILLEADAGHIIRAFGDVAVGGNLVVGMVVFFILTIVQFLVITKGAERVAEVGARFTLDAMPGKQMAIDMELRAGTMDADTAREKRALLARENQFFGSMDGAMKFVKGDAIAGIVILFTNLIGGLAIGIVQRAMSAPEALRLYSLLTIGDGLVAQIPALLIAITAGLLVTRVANGEIASPTEGMSGGPKPEINLSRELAHQLGSHPRAWATSGVAMAVLGFIPGMPTVVFLAIGAGASGFGIYRIRKEGRKSAAVEERAKRSVPEVREFDLKRPFMIKVGSHVADDAVVLHIQNVARQVRNAIVVELGLVLPAIDVEVSSDEQKEDFIFCQDEVRVFDSRIRISSVAFELLPEQMATMNVQGLDIESEGLYGARRRVWVQGESAISEWANAFGPGRTYWEVIAERFKAALLRGGPRYFGVQEAKKLSTQLVVMLPELGKELERAVPSGRLSEILQRLLYEQVSIRNIRVIMETLIEWSQRERDATLLTECVRAAVSREICAAIQGGNPAGVPVLALDLDIENLVRESIRQTAYGNYLALSPETSDEIIDTVDRILGETPPSKGCCAVLCAADVRPYVRKLLAERLPLVPVLSVAELASDQKVDVRGVIRRQEFGSEA